MLLRAPRDVKVNLLLFYLYTCFISHDVHIYLVAYATENNLMW